MPGPQHDGDPDTPPDDWVVVGSYPSFRKADERALVLLATGHESWLSSDVAGFHLLVPPMQSRAATAEIAAYEQESTEVRTRPKPPPAPPAQPGAWSISLLLAAFLLAFAWQTSDPAITPLGTNSTHGILNDHQGWRPFTALFLHADFAHLLGNLGGMALFGTLLIRSIGVARAFPGILITGTLGNLLNIALHYPEPHSSLGASTSVFGALGILAGCGFIELLRQKRSLPWRRIGVPLAGGLILLGWMGGGSPGSDTDVGAHIAGFVCGLAYGTLVKPPQPRRQVTDSYRK